MTSSTSGRSSTVKGFKRCMMAAIVIASAAFAASGDASGPAPAFTLTALTGQQAALSQYKGQVVMVNFWATWCGPCQQEMPLLDQMYKKYKPMGFTLIGISVDKTDAPVKDLMARKPVSFPVLLDPANQVSKAYHVDEMPSSVIIDRKGEIRYIHRGYRPGDENEYQDRIRQLIKE
jgi:peroxiredoxin